MRKKLAEEQEKRKSVEQELKMLRQSQMKIPIVPIVALNTLIVLISGIFDHILEEKKVVLTRVKAECILDVFCLMSKGNRKKVEEVHRRIHLVAPIDEIGEVVDEDVDADKEMYKQISGI